jgi:conjugative transposon TraN protein
MKALSQIVLFIATVTLSARGYGQLLPSFSLSPIGAQRIAITTNKMTNLIFPGAIRAGIKISREVTVQKVKGLENVIEVKAARKGFVPTNISVFCTDGNLYSFDLYYREDPDTLNFQVFKETTANLNPRVFSVLQTALPVPEPQLYDDALKMEREVFLHKSATNQKMRATLRGIYIKDSLLWLVCRLSNKSDVPFRPAYVRLFIVDRKRGKRTAIQQVPVVPVYIAPIGVVAGSGRQTLAVAYSIFTVAKEKKLVLEVAEENGGRLLTIPLSHKIVLRAKSDN